VLAAPLILLAGPEIMSEKIFYVLFANLFIFVVDAFDFMDCIFVFIFNLLNFFSQFILAFASVLNWSSVVRSFIFCVQPVLYFLLSRFLLFSVALEFFFEVRIVPSFVLIASPSSSSPRFEVTVCHHRCWVAAVTAVLLYLFSKTRKYFCSPSSCAAYVGAVDSGAEAACFSEAGNNKKNKQQHRRRRRRRREQREEQQQDEMVSTTCYEVCARQTHHTRLRRPRTLGRELRACAEIAFASIIGISVYAVVAATAIALLSNLRYLCLFTPPHKVRGTVRASRIHASSLHLRPRGHYKLLPRPSRSLPRRCCSSSAKGAATWPLEEGTPWVGVRTPCGWDACCDGSRNCSPLGGSTCGGFGQFQTPAEDFEAPMLQWHDNIRLSQRPTRHHPARCRARADGKSRRNRSGRGAALRTCGDVEENPGPAHDRRRARNNDDEENVPPPHDDDGQDWL
jgi:hypothetical protein